MRSDARCIRLVLPVMLAALAGGCAATRTGPYQSQREDSRDPARAQRLTLQAAELVDSDPVKAESLLREALSADLYHGPAHNNLGVVLLQRSPPDLYGAAGEFEWARKLLPGLPDPRMNLALTLEKAGRTDDAAAMYRTALEVYPGHIPTMQALARLQLRAGKADEQTPTMLREIAYRGEDLAWQQWARLQLARGAAER